MPTNTDPVRALLVPKLDMIISGYRINQDDADWLRGLLHRASAPPSAPVGVEGFEQWYARVDARFWNNWDACNAAFHAGSKAALTQQPAGVDEAMVERAVAAVMSAPTGISVEAYVRIVLEAALSKQPASPSGEAVAWVTRGSKRAHVRWFGAHEQSIPHGTKLYAAPQQPAAVDEAPTWSRQQPTVPGIYGIRGFNLCRPASEQFEAVVVVREHGGELVCNLHESTSEDDLESWAPICDLDPDFEWRVFVPGWQQQGGA